jgi:hypothetical protein
MKMEQTECSKTPAYKIQTPVNYPEQSIQHSNQIIAEAQTLLYSTSGLCNCFEAVSYQKLLGIQRSSLELRIKQLV